MDTFYEIYYNELKKLPTFNYNSSLISIYSFLEFSLKNICNQVQGKLYITISVDDISGSSYINTSKKYLEKIICINFKKVDKQWVEITKYQTIRNIIVHDNCSIIHGEKDIKESKNYNLLMQFKKIEIEPNYGSFIIKNYTLLLDFVDIVETFLTHIINEIENKNFKSLIDHFPSKPYRSFGYNKNNPFPVDEKPREDLPF